MNNNNIYNNTNYMIGMTHLDNYKITSNFILATSNILESHIYNASNTLESHIYNTSNTLESHLSNASNLLEMHSSNYTNAKSNLIMEYFKPLVDKETDVEGKTHTYINNCNILGEIRFTTLNCTEYAYNNNAKYLARIREDGQLQLYYNYTLQFPTVLGGWYGVMESIRDAYAYQATNGGVIAEVQAAINLLTNKLEALEQGVGAIAVNVQMLNGWNADQVQDLITDIGSHGYYDIFSTASIMGISAVGIIGIVSSWSAGVLYNDYLRAQYEQLQEMNNPNVSSAQKETHLTTIRELATSNLSNINSNLSNLIILDGFINSNITTAQTIPNIKTSNITINNTGSTTYSLINFSNATNNSAGYVGLGGIVSGYHNNNMIYKTPGAHVFNVPGQDSLSVPAFSINASACVGIGINPSAYPLYRFSVSGDIYIHTGGALRTNSIIYNSQELSTTLNNYLLKSGGTMTGALTTNSIIYNAQELSTTLNNYLLKSGGTMTGALTTNSIIYNNEELSTTLTNYLLKAGGTMNGRIVFNTGYYQDPSPTGFGDRIVLQTGIGTTGYNYSVGINTDVFWHSAPATASYKFYSGATNTATLNNVGLLTLPSINATTSITTPSIIYNGTELSTTVGNYLLKSGGTMTGQLAITANSASSLISLTNTGTVGQGILQTNNLGGYARLTYYNSGAGGYYTANYVLEASSNSAAIIMNTGGNTSNSIPRFILLSSGNIGIGISNPSAKLEVNGKIGCIGTLNCWSNVGIGVTNPYTLLHVRGTNPALTIMAQGGTGATSTINLSTYDHTTNSTNCSLVATDSGNFGATFQIRQKLAGADTNGLFTSFIMNVDGNVGIGSTTVAGIKLYVNGKTRFTDAVTFPNAIWHKSVDNIDRFYYDISGTTYFHSGNSGTPFVFRSYAQADIFTISNTGDISGNSISGSVGTFSGIIYPNGDNIKFPDTLNQFKINLWGTSNYGFGIASGTLMYSTQNWHKFYNFNVNTFTIDNNGDASLLRNLVTGGLTRSRNYHNYGTTLDYRTSFDGTNGPGWYMITNGFWQDISTVSYVCVAITCLGQNAVWFGRIFIGQGGGFYQTICDMRNPTNGNTNQIDVSDVWNSGGVNALKIVINNATYGGQFNVKFSG